MYTTFVLDAAIAFSLSAGDPVSAVVQHTSARASQPETTPVESEAANKEEAVADWKNFDELHMWLNAVDWARRTDEDQSPEARDFYLTWSRSLYGGPAI